MHRVVTILLILATPMITGAADSSSAFTDLRNQMSAAKTLPEQRVIVERMREALQGVELALMISTMLHSIATGNLLPASVRTVAVDINPAVVTKLADRGSWQTVGLVTDAELFLRELALSLERVETD